MANLDVETTTASLEGSQRSIRVCGHPECQPGADVIETWSEVFSLDEFTDMKVWMAGLVELWVMGLFIFTGGALSIALSNQKNIESPFLLSLIAAILAAIILPLFIFAALPASGGHINPLITLGAFFIRAASFPRTLIYIVAQTIGATVGASLLNGALGNNLISGIPVPGCTWSPTNGVTLPQVFILETVSGAAFLFVSFAAGLDPRRKAFGLVVGPLIIGLSLGVLVFVTGVVRPGYTGVSVNPARCFGLLAATGGMRGHWVHWVGALAAAGMSGVAYLAMPPWRKRKSVQMVGEVV